MFEAGDQVRYIDRRASPIFKGNIIYTVDRVGVTLGKTRIGLDKWYGFFAAERFELVESYPTLRSDYV